jgi:hypothetical protein
MAYRHITSCVAFGQQKSKWQVILSYGVPAAVIAGVLGAIFGGGVGAVIAIGAVWSLPAVLGFCDWWHHYRLICIEDDQCAVGTVGRTAVSHGITDPDLDFTINLVLAPVLTSSRLKAGDQLKLLSANQKRYLTRHFLTDVGWDPDYISTAEEGESGGTTALHCEIEGNGMTTVCAAATTAAVAGTAAGVAAGAAAAAACAATGLFALLCLLGALLAAALASGAVAGAGWVAGVALGGDEGSPADVAADPASGTVEVGDHVAIIGDWIFDNAHTGWHELHPVKKLLKLPCKKGTEVAGVDPEYPDSERSRAIVDEACARHLADRAGDICYMLQQPGDPDVKTAQDEPKNKWEVHPALG